jgi:hypothetical protein
MSVIEWKSFIKPTDLEIVRDGKTVSFQTIPKTDWWRTGKVHSTSGAYVGVEHDRKLGEVEGLSFEASVKVEGKHQVRPGGYSSCSSCII